MAIVSTQRVSVVSAMAAPHSNQLTARQTPPAPSSPPPPRGHRQRHHHSRLWTLVFAYAFVKVSLHVRAVVWLHVVRGLVYVCVCVWRRATNIYSQPNAGDHKYCANAGWPDPHSFA